MTDMFERITKPCPIPTPFSFFQHNLRTWMKDYDHQPLVFMDRMDRVYAYLTELVQDEEYYLMALKLEDQIQAAICYTIFDVKDEAKSAATCLMREYGAIDDPILKLASPFENMMLEDARNYRKKKVYSPAMQLVQDMFQHDYSQGSNDNFGFAGRLSRQLGGGTFLQARFFKYYFENESLFKNTENVILRRMALNYFNRKRELQSIKKELIRNDNALASFDQLVHKSYTNLSWLTGRDIQVIHSISHGKWQAGELSAAGVPVNLLMEKLQETMDGRKPVAKSRQNFLRLYRATSGELKPAVAQRALHTVALLFESMEFNKHLSDEFNEALNEVLASQDFSDDEKVGAYIHKVLQGKNPESLKLSDTGLDKLPGAIIEIAKTPHQQLELFRHFGIDGHSHKIVNRVKRNALDEDFGL